MITGPVSWYWESGRGRCREDAPDSFQSTAHPQGVCGARLCAAKLAGLVAAGLNFQINTDKTNNFHEAIWELISYERKMPLLLGRALKVRSTQM